MAEIPELQQSPGIDYITPTHQPYNVDAAGMTGERIHEAGKALMNFGTTLGEVDAKKSSAKRILDMHEAGLAYERGLNQVEQEIRKHGASDGSDWGTIFNENADKLEKTVRANYKNSDALTQEGVGNSIIGVRNKVEERILIKSDQQRTSALLEGYHSSSALLGAATFARPEDFDQNMAKFNILMKAAQEHGVMDASTQLRTHKEGGAMIANQAIDGMLMTAQTNAQFDQARAMYKKVQPFLLYAGETVSQAAIKRINDAQYTMVSRSQIQEARADAADARAEKEDHKDALAEVIVAIGEAKGDPKALRAADQLADSQLFNLKYGEPEWKQAKAVLHAKNDPKLDPNGITYFRMLEQIMTSGKDQTANIKELNSMVADQDESKRMLGGQKGAELLRVALRQKKEEVKNPLYATERATYFAEAKRMFGLPANKDSIPPGWQPEFSAQYNEMTRKGEEWMASHPGKTWLNAIDNVLYTHSAVKPVGPIPGMPASFQNDPKKITEYIGDLVKKQLMTPRTVTPNNFTWFGMSPNKPIPNKDYDELENKILRARQRIQFLEDKNKQGFRTGQ